MLSAEQLELKLEVFEGPLDLLLHLIKVNKVSITDIPIAMILSQYMDYLKLYEVNNIEISSEFLVIASQLVLIKSKILLPNPKDEEADDPRAELINTLLEYQKFKQVSQQLVGMSAISEGSYIRRAEQIEKDNTYTYSHMSQELLDAFYDIFQRKQDKLPPPASAFTEYIVRQTYSVDEKITHILRCFKKSETVELRSLFGRAKSLSEVIVIFLAVLELCKRDEIIVAKTKNDYTLTLYAGGEKRDAIN